MNLPSAAIIVAALAGSTQAPAAPCPRVEVVEVMPGASPGTRPVGHRGHTIHVSRTPLAALNDVVDVAFREPGAIALTFTRDVAARMERATARADFPMAVVIDNEALVSVVLQGGFGIGGQGLQVSLDNEERARQVAASLVRALRQCSDRTGRMQRE